MIPQMTGSLAITDHECGPGTGDDLVQTEDGRWWRRLRIDDRQDSTGSQLGDQIGNRLYPRSGWRADRSE